MKAPSGHPVVDQKVGPVIFLDVLRPKRAGAQACAHAYDLTRMQVRGNYQAPELK